VDTQPEKQTVRVSIFNQKFTLLVAGDPAEIQQAAHDVEELMNTIARFGNMDTSRIAILACLHLQDRVRSLESDLAQLRSRVEGTSKDLAGLLDDAIG
jgi:cell division protein ZapA